MQQGFVKFLIKPFKFTRRNVFKYDGGVCSPYMAPYLIITELRSNYTSYTSRASIAGVHKNSEVVSSGLDSLDSAVGASLQSHPSTTLKIITTTASIRRLVRLQYDKYFSRTLAV
jgi:hypothetical protein